MVQNHLKMAETLTYGYSSESSQRGLSYEYQHDRVQMVLNIFLPSYVWSKVALALKGLSEGGKGGGGGGGHYWHMNSVHEFYVHLRISPNI